MLGPDTHVHPSKRGGVNITLSNYGRFDGFVFVFHEPVRARDGRKIRRLDLTGAMLDADWSPQEVIAALLFPLPDEQLADIERETPPLPEWMLTGSGEVAYPPDSVPVTGA